MRLKQELVTAVELVNGVLKHEQLKCEASQQAKAVWRSAKILPASSASFLRCSTQKRMKNYFTIRRE
jgi:hypothetical protein